jgi:hypothetical protein
MTGGKKDFHLNFFRSLVGKKTFYPRALSACEKSPEIRNLGHLQN